MNLKFFENEAFFDPLLKPHRVRADKIMVGMNLFLLVVCLGLAPINNSYLDVILVGLPTFLLSYLLMRQYAGELPTRLYMACSFMAFTGLIIHQTGGDIEGHFSAFGLVGVLLYYRDWRTVLAATVFIYLHHLVLGYAQTLGVPVYVFDDDRFWILFAIHVAYFLPFIGMMMLLSVWLRREGYEAQRVINLAQHIIQGNLVAQNTIEPRDIDKPLIQSVIAMKNRLLDLLKIMPVPAAVIRLNEDRVASINQAWVRTLGPLNDDELNFSKAFIWPDEESWMLLLEKVHGQKGRLLDKIEQPLKKRDGTHILCELSLILHKNIEPAMAILTVEDITDRRKAEQAMKNLAYNDLLTGLPNRAFLEETLNNALTEWKDAGTPFAIALLDLDGFKQVNDSYGHDAGDEALKVVAARFNQHKRKEDLIARLGGDEFVLVIKSCNELAAGVCIAERLVQSLDSPIHLRGTPEEIHVNTSAGVAMIDPEDFEIKTILKRADQALYQAKGVGKNQVKAIA